jgi:hypothetical protein
VYAETVNTFMSMISAGWSTTSGGALVTATPPGVSYAVSGAGGTVWFGLHN